MSAEVDLTRPDVDLVEPVEEPIDPLAEVKRLSPDPSPVTLSNGIEVDVAPMKARQFFKLLKIITRGAGGLMGTLMFNKDPEMFVGQLYGLLIIAVPEAPDESIDFVRSLVKIPDIPGPHKGGQPLTDEGKIVAAKVDLINQVLSDPELEDIIEILAEVFKRESEDLVALGKRLQSLLEVATKTGQLQPTTQQAS